jgi:hypothetical protein
MSTTQTTIAALKQQIATLNEKLKTAIPTGPKAGVLNRQIANIQEQIKQLSKKRVTVTKAKKEYTITFLGKVYNVGPTKKYKDLQELANKLKVDVNDLKKYESEASKERFFINDNFESIKIDISKKKPLLLKEFNVKKITNRQLIKQSNKLTREGKVIKMYSTIPDDQIIKVFVSTTVYIKYSNDWFQREFTRPILIQNNFDISDINQLTRESAQEYFKVGEPVIGQNYEEYFCYTELDRHINFNDCYELIELVKNSVRYKPELIYPPAEYIRNNQDGQTMDIVDMQLRDEQPPSISNMYNNVITNTNWKHCIHDYMYDTLGKKYSKKTLEKINTTRDIYEFSKSKQIKMIAYDINGKVIMSYYPEETRKHTSRLIFIAHNNHLYPIKNKYLDKVKPVSNDTVVIDDSLNQINTIIDNGSYPSNIKISGAKDIISFMDNGVKYICNSQYNDCKQVLAKFGLSDKIYDNIKIMALGSLISKLYVNNNDNSVFLESNRFAIPGYIHLNKDIKGETKTIDANKFYPSCLRDLKYLIKVDMIKTSPSNNNELEEDHYLYIASPKQSSVLMPETGCYTGDFLKYCKEQGLEFTLIQKIQTTKIENHYTNMINDLYNKLDQSTFKNIMNVFIGKFEHDSVNYNYEFVKFVNADELKTVDKDYYIKTVNDNLFIVFKIHANYNIFNKKPIAIQIKQESRKRLYDMMVLLGLNDSNIKAVHTDSITYVGPDAPKSFIGTGLSQWKYIKPKNFFNSNQYYDNFITFGRETSNNNNIMGICYAGTGKTHRIKNDILHNLNIDDTIIMSPSHASIKEYRKLYITDADKKKIKYNCDVIQKYEFNNLLVPTQQNIIIDEVGMVSLKGLHLLYKWFKLGKRIIAYGDFKQLLPVGEINELNSSIFINTVFGIIDELTYNRRNNFNRQFYDDIINNKLDYITYVKRYRSKYSTNIICYRNETCDNWNKKISQKLNIRDKFAVGARIICNTNDLREHDIYNKHIFTVVEEMKDKVILDNGLTIEKETMNKKDGDKQYFTLAYARTLHSVQGESIPNFWFPDEDIKYIDTRFAYTLISRLKGTFNIEDKYNQNITCPEPPQLINLFN